MSIEEMHVTFRELAQQMGMQTVRAILSEDIDICINAAIIDKTKEIIASTIGPLPYNDKVSRQNVALSPINALRTLYKNKTLTSDELGNGFTEVGSEVNPYTLNISSEGIMLFTSFKLSYNGNTLYDCRIIENEDLGQTLRDFCNRAAKDAPICSIFGETDSITVNFYTGRRNMPKPIAVNYTYIKEPAKVYYDEDTPENNINCDLPTYLHMDIIKIAVGIYLQSIGAVSNNKNDN